MKIVATSSILVLAALIGGARSAAAGPVPAAPLDFNRQIRPILSDKCLRCHGPDERTRKAGLRLDDPASAAAGLPSGRLAIVPGDLGKSAVAARISSKDPDFAMPPRDTGKSLSKAEVELLRRWILEGARYQQHWSLVPPRRPPVPALEEPPAGANAIDAFLRAELARRGVAPAAEADRATHLRRLSLDLAGLPPTPEELDAFLADGAPDAYARAVDRLLASPHFGERMALEWLDAARYGDTNGYHIDNERFLWRWRDWVIDAFNANVPFDRFTIEQLAGDLLPDASPSARIASGFNRNHMINFEGGAIPEEYQVQYVIDRVNTTATVWLGLTFGCAQCHDHKFDPLTTEDYYRFYAFFNNVPEIGLDGNMGNAAPSMRAPLPGQEERLAAARERLRALEVERDGPVPEVDAAQVAWEADVAERALPWEVLEPLWAISTQGTVLARQPDGSFLASGKLPANEDYEVLALVRGAPIGALRLEALPDASLPQGGPGRFGNGNFVLSELQVEAAPADGSSAPRAVELAAVHADYSQRGYAVGRAIDGDPSTGWAVLADAMGAPRTALFVPRTELDCAGGILLRIRLSFASAIEQHSIGRFRIALSRDLARRPGLLASRLSPWRMSGSFAAADAGAALNEVFPPERFPSFGTELIENGDLGWTELAAEDGKIFEFEAPDPSATYFARTIDAPTARVLRASFGSDDGIAVWLNGERVLDNPTARSAAPDQDLVDLSLAAGANRLLVKVADFGGQSALYFERREDAAIEPPLAVAAVLATPAAARVPADAARLRRYFRERHWPRDAELAAAIAEARAEVRRAEASIPETMVMAELESPRMTNILVRGQYDQKADPVEPGVPRALPPLELAEGARKDRLALARWLVDGRNPLTARVAVNRLWQMIFGTGLVKTAEDFGSQGEPPSHPDLLDWLACEFVESGWDVKHLVRLMVSSAAYRQVSTASGALLALDPDNRLLARAPRLRLSAELVRDNALAIAGLLNPAMHGPSVKVYQPAGLWEEMSLDPSGATYSAQTFVQDVGDKLYRKSLYVFRKRTVPQPSLAVFDAPNRETCVVRRQRTNTPLQALVLMNDPTYVEAARHLAQRTVAEPADGDGARLSRAFRRATARLPSERESAILLGLLESERKRFGADAAAAAALLRVGDSAADGALDPVETAAWTVVASAILNLDETISRG